MRQYVLPVLTALLPTVASAAPSPTFYICAHPDDCILFMNPNLYDDSVRAEQKVVVVYLTSGDANYPFSKKGSPLAYPNVRELASVESSKWMADIDKEGIHTKPQTEAVSIHGHSINRISYANTVSYFLRLPDGNYYGEGFKRYGYQSLKKLKSGEIRQITPIDGSASYKGWQDLTGVLSGILTREAPGEKSLTLHIQEPDIEKNTDDHSDHTTGATAITEVLKQRTANEQDKGYCDHLYKHIDYSIAQKPVNLEGEALQNKAGSFAVLTAAQRRFLDFHNWDKAHRPYLTRNYYTIETLPADCDKITQ